MQILRTLSAMFGVGRRLKWGLLVMLALVLSGLEVIGAAMIYLLLTIVTDPDSSVDLPMFGDPKKLLPGLSSEQLVLAVAVTIGVFFVFRGLFVIGQAYAQARVVNNACAEVGTRLVGGYLAMPYWMHLERSSSELIRNAFYNIAELNRKLLRPGVQVVAETLVILGLTIGLLLIAPAPTALAILIFAPTVWVLLRAVKPKMRAYGVGAKEAESRGLRFMQQGLLGIRELRIFGAERSFVKEYRRTRAEFAHYNTRMQTMTQVPRVLLEALLVLFIAGFFAILVTLGLAGPGAFSILGLFAYAILRIKPSLQVIVNGVNQIRHATPSLEDVSADLQACSPYLREASEDTRHVPTLQLELALNEVSFWHRKSDTAVLDQVSLSIARGETIGVCGPTGSGKSTLVDVIAGLLVPTSGTVTVDGIDVREDPPGWYRQLGIASQSVFVLDDTVRNNIALGVRPDEIDETALEQAIDIAQLRDVIAEMPDGLETRLGEGGSRLSGGQRQRVAIARALYRAPEILIFDEATAALDNETEAALVEALGESQGHRTVILVAHRLSSLRYCNRVIVVEQGRLSDSGSYSELVERHPLFESLRTQSTGVQ